MGTLFTLRSVRLTAVLGLVAVVIGLVLARAGSVQAAGVVSTCTEAGFAAAWNSGNGNISFSCGPAPVTITLSLAGGYIAGPGSFRTVDGSNGGNRVTLSGQTLNRLFAVQSGAALTLTNITLTDGYAASGGSFPMQGGAILVNGGFLLLDHATIRDSQSSLAGGALEVAAGSATVSDSLIENNQSDYGGGIDSIGTLTLIRSIVRDNHAVAHNGGGLDVGGTVVINNSQIISNTAYGMYVGEGGGGLNVVAGGDVSISASRFDGNQASTVTAAYGGAILNQGVLTVSQSTISGNSAHLGGGIYGTGTLMLTNSTLSGNRADAGGGGIGNDGTATLRDSTLSGNSAVSGGGLLNFSGGPATLSNITLSGNSAGSGGGIYNLAYAMLTLTNTTLSGNGATSDNGGGIYNAGTVTLTNVTLSGNSATLNGGAIYHYATDAARTINLKNTIVANSPSGGNCYLDPSSVTTITSLGYNLSSDISCQNYFTLGTDLPPSTDPNLGPLANNGGLTLTHMPLTPDSPGIDRIPKFTNGCGTSINTDQRGAPRPINLKCDIGSVEYGASFPWLYLPLIRR